VHVVEVLRTLDVDGAQVKKKNLCLLRGSEFTGGPR
jgi:hypothetical protein